MVNLIFFKLASLFVHILLLFQEIKHYCDDSINVVKFEYACIKENIILHTNHTLCMIKKANNSVFEVCAHSKE